MIAIIDYGAGNLRSVTNAIDKLGYQAKITGKPEDVLSASAVILPGVGAASDAMANLKKLRLDSAIREVIGQGTPFLGVCLGLQLMMDSTEEDNNQECLGIIPGKVRKFSFKAKDLKIPHMGWNQVKLRVRHPVFDGVPENANFYFVHSYYADPKDEKVVGGVTDYGIPFCSVLAKDNLVATQFHPEKSGDIGLKIYDNFIKQAMTAEAKRS